MRASAPIKLNLQFTGIIPVAVLLFAFFSFDFPVGQPVGQSPPARGAEVIKIGVLITADTADNSLTRQAVDVIQLVVDRVNRSGGIRGQRVEMVVKSVEGRWGGGSKRSVSLIYEDNVSAILGFLDGRSAHLTEQVCTKAEIPFVSTFSPDPTLSRINIPWFFSTMPHAGQQAEALASEIFAEQEKQKVTVISSDDYDMQFLTRSFMRRAGGNGSPAPTVLTYRSGAADFKGVVSNIAGSKSEGIVFFGSGGEWEDLIAELRNNKISLPLFVPIMEQDETVLAGTGPTVFTIQPDRRHSEARQQFQETFSRKYGYRPGPLSDYVYNGVVALLESVRVQGLTNREIREGLASIDINGMNGPFSFDSSGVIETRLEISRIVNPE